MQRKKTTTMTTAEKEVLTLDGAVDRHGRPAVRGKTGTWVAGILLLGTFVLEHTMHFDVFLMTQKVFVRFT